MILHSFDVRGKFAHFRKYYANNTALSFTLPPPTTIMGMLGGMLGLPRDSYYEMLGPEQLQLGIGLRSPIKKSFHRLNLLKIEGGGDFRGQKGRVQIPFEIVSGHNPRQDEVVYRIYVASSKDNELLDRIGQLLAKGERVFNLSLGTANFSASVEQVRLSLIAEKQQAGNDFIPFCSAVPVHRIQELDISNGKIFIEEDMMPSAFIKNYDREVAAMQRVIYATNGEPFMARISGEYFSIDQKENFTLLT